MSEVKTNTARSYARPILRNYHALVERQYKGDMDAVATLVDLRRAIALSRLTKRQQQAIYYVYGEDMTQKDAGKQMGVGQDVISVMLATAESTIDEIFESWTYKDEAETRKEAVAA